MDDYDTDGGSPWISAQAVHQQIRLIEAEDPVTAEMLRSLDEERRTLRATMTDVPPRHPATSIGE